MKAKIKSRKFVLLIAMETHSVSNKSNYMSLLDMDLDLPRTEEKYASRLHLCLWCLPVEPGELETLPGSKSWPLTPVLCEFQSLEMTVYNSQEWP